MSTIEFTLQWVNTELYRLRFNEAYCSARLFCRWGTQCSSG